MSTATAFEIQYYVPGKGTKQKSFKSNAARQRWIEKLLDKEGDDVQVSTRES